MNRRELFVAAAAAAFAPSLKAHAGNDKNDRLVFKVVTMTPPGTPEPPALIYRLGDEQWTPTREDLETFRDGIAASMADSGRDFIVTNQDVRVTAIPSTVMVKVDFGDLKPGDHFALYEGKMGERVPGVWACTGDPYKSDGVWNVPADAVEDVLYHLPAQSPV